MDEDVEIEIIALQSWAHGGQLTSVAIALALIDAGLIKKDRLLAIIESLHAILAADYVRRAGDIDDAERGLNFLREWLDGSQWRVGQVLEFLHTHEALEILRSQTRSANAKHRQQSPSDESD